MPAPKLSSLPSAGNLLSRASPIPFSITSPLPARASPSNDIQATRFSPSELMPPQSTPTRRPRTLSPSRSTRTIAHRSGRRKSAVLHSLSAVHRPQIPFPYLPYTSYNAAAGNTLGDELLHRRQRTLDHIKHHKRRRKITQEDYRGLVTEFTKEFRGVGEFVIENPWFMEFLVTVTENKIGILSRGSSNTSGLLTVESRGANPNSPQSRQGSVEVSPKLSPHASPFGKTKVMPIPPPEFSLDEEGADDADAIRSSAASSIGSIAMMSIIAKIASTVTSKQSKPAPPTLQYGRLLGAKFSKTLFTSATADSAVDEFLLQASASNLATLLPANPWLKTFLENIAHHFILLSSWGYKARLALALTLTYSDLFADLIVTKQFHDADETALRDASLAIIAVGVVVQCILVFLQYRHHVNGVREVLKQLLATVAFLRPYIDMHDVIVSTPLDGKLFSPSLWWFTGRVITSLFISMPQMVVQLTVVVNGGGSWMVWLSVAIASLSVAFTVSLAAFDIESFPYNVKTSPDIYGILPDSTELRLVALTVMTGLTAIVSFCRAYSLSIAVVAGKRVAVWYCATEFAVFVAIKYYHKGTLNYWIVMGEPAKTAVGWLKTVVDYIVVTAVPSVQMRHPLEIGGRCMLVSVAVFLFSNFGLLKAAEVYSGAPSDVRQYKVVGACQALVLVQFGILYSVVKKKYTFTQTRTGKEYATQKFERFRAFHDADHDYEVLVGTCFLNDEHRPESELVSEFFRERFEVWEREGPGWYTPAMRDEILDHPDFADDMWERYCGEDEEAPNEVEAVMEETEVETKGRQRVGSDPINLTLDDTEGRQY